MGQKREAAIVGIHEYPKRRCPGMSQLQIKMESAAAALEDAGLAFKDVDAVYDCGDGGGAGIVGLHIADYFNINPTIIDNSTTGGSSWEVHAGHAMRDIARGKANVALLTYGSTTRSLGSNIASGSLPTPMSNVEDPYGVTLIANYAMVKQRHMHQYGTPQEAFAEISVVTRAHAMRNPEAVQALEDLNIKNIGEITPEDVTGSRMIADPLHILECCMVSDGGGAVIIASPDVARGTKQKPVWILGSGEAAAYPRYGRDITVSAAAQTGPAAFGEAGVRPEEVDIAMIYDSFTITTMCLLEDLGFCKKGEFLDWANGGRLRWDNPARPALNTDGGGLSSNHPGARGIFLLIEATRQLRGQSTSQVAGAQLAVASGCGGQLGTHHVSGTAILAKD